jgi:hypothetical protein
MVIANDDEEYVLSSWEPIPNEPIGTPRGANPGRVVWVWDPEATESNLQGYWWYKHNNNQNVIDDMFSTGLQGLSGANNDFDSWDVLFKYFNIIHGNGEIGYQTGEKIAIKVNLNNAWTYFNPYTNKDNDRDASPYLVKSLLRQLVNVVGINQEDITIYDASRPMPNWFYNRVYYETYPDYPLIPEFPNVIYKDMKGEATGRQKVIPSNEKIYFADETGLDRTLPVCVAEADYLINIPILKRHPIQQGITLSAKNLFGTWIESVRDVHDYHQAAFTQDNPTPQTDLIAHEEIGRKTVLYIGDGLFATKIDHATIGKFEMYPFNDDWTNSLFFSQDPVAIDSVMYDFLHAEGTDPCEGSQNYLHQSAEPLSGIYDPENDGIFLSESLGVHEHWNKSTDIFSSERYLGPINNGIDYVTFGEENAESDIFFISPKENYLYLFNEQKIRLRRTIIIGSIEVEARVNGITEEIEKVEFYLDDNLKHTTEDEPWIWPWEKPASINFNLLGIFGHELKIIAHYGENHQISKSMSLIKFL